MKIHIVKNRYLNAFLGLLLVSATIHFFILCLLVIINRDISYLNYFNILNLNYFFPNIFDTFWGVVASVIVEAGLFLGILYTNKTE